MQFSVETTEATFCFHVVPQGEFYSLQFMEARAKRKAGRQSRLSNVHLCDGVQRSVLVSANKSLSALELRLEPAGDLRCLGLLNFFNIC